MDHAPHVGRALLREDAAWLPRAAGTSLYLRPFMIATEPFLGVRPSKSYLLAVILHIIAKRRTPSTLR